MPKIVVDEDENKFKEKLDFIGLNIEKLPKFLSNSEPLEFGVSGANNEDNEHRIFKYIPIQDVQILISPTNRLHTIKEKYSLAKPINVYLNPKNIEEYSTFLKMIDMFTIEEIEKIEESQEKFDEKIPFSVQYEKDYSWQIYYAEKTEQYFMIVTSEDYEFNSFFYLLREQLKYHKSRKKVEKKIYVPINYINYSEDFLKKSEISDIENYLWLFTKNWPRIYEVYDKNNNMYLEIIGTTNVYRSITSEYKIVLNSKEESIKYYKGLKALFILQTELSSYYKFETRINDCCELELYYKLNEINYDNIGEIINQEYKIIRDRIETEKQDIGKLEKRLEELKQVSSVKDLEYLKKQKEIAMYLEYKKSFLGKIKLFLKYKSKKNNEKEDVNLLQTTENISDSAIRDVDKEILNEKSNYTIEDLILLYAKLEKETNYVKNMKSDIHALELKLKHIEKKIENATKYIEEIDNHKKSIFEFWKFVNKDEQLAMEEAAINEEEANGNNLKRVFDYELDLTELGIQMDKLQRKLFNKEAQDSIFLLDSDIKEYINIIKSNIDIDIDKLRNKLNNLKQLAEVKKKLYNADDFDIFGGVTDDYTKVKTLANQKHRETEKDVLKVLNIGQNTDVEEFKSRLEIAEKIVGESINQVKSNYDMPVYVAVSNSQMIDKVGYAIYHIIPENALKCAENINSDKINLYKLNISQGMPLIYYSNIIYYNNFNETLPFGMNVSDKILIDASKFEFIPKNMITFKVCESFEYEALDKPIVKTIMLCEYELNLK